MKTLSAYGLFKTCELRKRMTTPEISVPAIIGLWKVDTIVTIVDTLRTQ